MQGLCIVMELINMLVSVKNIIQFSGVSRLSDNGGGEAMSKKKNF